MDCYEAIAADIALVGGTAKTVLQLEQALLKELGLAASTPAMAPA